MEPERDPSPEPAIESQAHQQRSTEPGAKTTTKHASASSSGRSAVATTQRQAAAPAAPTTHSQHNRRDLAGSSASIVTESGSLTAAERKQLGQLVASTPFHCRLCKASFSSLSLLRAHLGTRHDQHRVLVCDLCCEMFRDAIKLREHMKSHFAGGRLVCTVCTKDFARRDRLRDHLRIHAGVKPYRCRQCGRTFSRRDRLRTHIDAKHGNDASAQLDVFAAAAAVTPDSNNSDGPQHHSRSASDVQNEPGRSSTLSVSSTVSSTDAGVQRKGSGLVLLSDKTATSAFDLKRGVSTGGEYLDSKAADLPSVRPFSSLVVPPENVVSASQQHRHHDQLHHMSKVFAKPSTPASAAQAGSSSQSSALSRPVGGQPPQQSQYRPSFPQSPSLTQRGHHSSALMQVGPTVSSMQQSVGQPLTSLTMPSFQASPNDRPQPVDVNVAMNLMQPHPSGQQLPASQPMQGGLLALQPGNFFSVGTHHLPMQNWSQAVQQQQLLQQQYHVLQQQQMSQLVQPQVAHHGPALGMAPPVAFQGLRQHGQAVSSLQPQPVQLLPPPPPPFIQAPQVPPPPPQHQLQQLLPLHFQHSQQPFASMAAVPVNQHQYQYQHQGQPQIVFAAPPHQIQQSWNQPQARQVSGAGSVALDAPQTPGVGLVQAREHGHHHYQQQSKAKPQPILPAPSQNQSAALFGPQGNSTS